MELSLDDIAVGILFVFICAGGLFVRLNVVACGAGIYNGSIFCGR